MKSDLHHKAGSCYLEFSKKIGQKLTMRRCSNHCFGNLEPSWLTEHPGIGGKVSRISFLASEMTLPKTQMESSKEGPQLPMV